MPPAFETAAATSRQWVKAKMGNSIPRLSQSSLCTGDLLIGSDRAHGEPVFGSRRTGRHGCHDLPATRTDSTFERRPAQVLPRPADCGGAPASKRVSLSIGEVDCL